MREATDAVGRLTESDGPLLASELVRFELLTGVRPRELAAVEEFFTAVEWVPVTQDRSTTSSPGPPRPSVSIS